MCAKQRQAIRWTLNGAAAEFPIAKETLSGRLLKLGEKPGDDGKFSTTQICAAVFPPQDGHKSRLLKEQADRIALDNEERRRNLISVSDALIVLRRYCFAIRQKILAMDATTEDKNAVISEINRMATADVSKMPDGDGEGSA